MKHVRQRALFLFALTFLLIIAGFVLVEQLA